MRGLAITWFVAVMAMSPALRAQSPATSSTPTARSVKILFVGNSFTHGKYLPVRTYNAKAVTDENADLPPTDPRAHHTVGEEGSLGGIPGIFKKMTDEAGLNYEVHIEAVSAKTLGFHYEHELSVIAQPGWDVVVLQGYSTEPLPVERGGKPESFLTNIALLEKAIHAANPHARVYLEETWPRADLVYPEKSLYHDASVDQMVTDLRASCNRAEAKSESELQTVRIGDAWQRAMREGIARINPYLPPEPGKLDLWGQDHYHPSIYGAYLSAVMLVTEVASVSSTTLRLDEQAARDLGISPADAGRLQHLGAVAVDLRKPVPATNQ